VGARRERPIILRSRRAGDACARPLSFSLGRAVSVWWKLYLLMIVIQVIGVPLGALHLGSFGLGTAVEWVLTTGGAVGLFGYVFGKPIAVRAFWQAFAPVFIAWDIVFDLILRGAATGQPTSYYVATCLLFLFSLPQCLALYRYAYSPTQPIWQPQHGAP